MKKQILTLLFLAWVAGLQAQMYITGGTVKVVSNGVVGVVGDLNTASGTTLNNAGIVSVGGHFTNLGTLGEAGDYTVGKNFTTNAGVLTPNNNLFAFDGVFNSTVTVGSNYIGRMRLNKASGGLVYLGDSQSIGSELDFNTDNNKVDLNGFTLTINSAASILSFDDNEYVITGGSGFLKKKDVGPTPFTFPVGFNNSSYNPLTIANSGTPDHFGVRCLEDALANGSSGSPLISGAIKSSWEITEDVAGASNLEITAGWSLSDEQVYFTRSDCGVARHDGVTWTMFNADMGAALGSNPYTRNRLGMSSLGYFTVGGTSLLSRLLVETKTFLHGPFNTGTGWMNDNLRSLNLLDPSGMFSQEPYTGLTGFTHLGRGGGEIAYSPALEDFGNNSIVDWVFLTLYDNTNTPVQTKSAFIQRDGDVVDTDGVSEPYFLGMPDGNYYVSIRHRNHLGVKTSGTIALSSSSSVLYDFTTGASQAAGGVQKLLTGSVYGMHSGNANVNNTVRVTGPAAINDYTRIINILGGNYINVISNIYSVGDINMDGTVRVTGPAAINDNSKIINSLGGNYINIITQGF